MLATAGTGQHLTGYNSMYGGPRQPGEIDGPDEFHVVLLDNHRTRLLADAEQRDALHCIRCGACLNVCPIFKNIGGHAYGTTYQGPIGSVITPHFRGLAGLEASQRRVVPLRRLHGGVPGEDRYPSSPSAKPAQCRRGKESLVGAAHLGRLRLADEAAVGVSHRHPARAAGAGTASAGARHPARPRALLDRHARFPGSRAAILSRLVAASERERGNERGSRSHPRANRGSPARAGAAPSRTARRCGLRRFRAFPRMAAAGPRRCSRAGRALCAA